MANGYVPRFMQPPPFGMMPHHPLQRPSNPADPNALFERPKPAFCAFPDDGPNVFQQAFSSLSGAALGSLTWVWGFPWRLLGDGIVLAQQDTDVLTKAVRENSWSIIIGLVIVAVLCVLAWFFSPKGENQTVWRSTLILSMTSCYLMWAITFLAQWHPLIEPKMAGFRGSADWSGAD